MNHDHAIMRNAIFRNATVLLTLTGILLMSLTAVFAQENAARNPVLWADVPDPSIVRVGDTYYMSSTTMHMNPGLPILKSRDLVNWRLVSYAYDTLEEKDATTLQNGKNEYGRGSWASSLRFHDGVFYATTFSQTTGKTYIFTTRDPEKGPWHRTEFAPALHDHSLFFDDDGRVYMVTGAGNLRLVELKPDVSGILPGGINQVIVPDASRVAGPNVGLPAEGSQLFKVNGKYYLFCITWPRRDMRTELVFRADKITGPYEGRVVFHDQGIAQGGIVDTPDGKWHAYLFQDHGAVGRTPFVIPLVWSDGWPVVGADGKLPATLDLPASRGLGHSLVPGLVASDEFGSPTLGLTWQWNHIPDSRGWSLTERPGWLRLKPQRVDAALPDARNTLTQRMFGPTCSGTVALDTRGLKDGDLAGLAAFQKNYGFVGVKRTGNDNSLVMVSAESGTPVEIASFPLAQPIVFLRIDADFRNRADRAVFSYSLNGTDWHSLGTPLKMSYTLPHFMGYRFALFHIATRTAGGTADFDFFHVSP